MKSIFENGHMTSYPALENDITAEIAVIGGGIAGILTAFHLAEKGRRVVLLEAGQICRGTTSKSTATITALQGLLYGGMRERYSDKTASAYLSSQTDAVAMYKKIVEENSIDCDFEIMPAYLFSLDGAEEELEKEFAALQNLGADISKAKDNGGLPFETGIMLKLENQAQINILKFVSALPKRFEIYENTRVTDICVGKKVITTEKGNTVKADKIVIATKFPIINCGLHFLKMYQTKSYVVTFEYPRLDGFHVDISRDGLYIRSYNGRVLLGGFDHRTGREKCGETYKLLKDRAKRYFKAGEIELSWSAEDAITFDGIPFAGALGKKHKDVYIVTGFNEWGISNAMVTSKLICNLICGENDKYKELFSPRRRYLRNTKCEFLRHVCATVAGLTTGLFRLPLCFAKKLEPGEAKICVYKCKRVAAYRDEAGKLHTFKSTCSHLHCGLKFNYTDKVWECPCHGSRYGLDGNVIDAPAIKTIITGDKN